MIKMKRKRFYEVCHFAEDYAFKVLIGGHFHMLFGLEFRSFSMNTILITGFNFYFIEKCNQIEEQEVELARITMEHDLLRSEKERLENDLNGWYHSNHCIKCHIYTANLIISNQKLLLLL